MNRKETTDVILSAKRRLGLTWATIAAAVGHSEVWVTTALLGQATMTAADVARVAEVLEIEEASLQTLTEVPHRGERIEEMPPRDPTLYRLYEILLVYGPSMKELIHEKFGDGIMSAIDFAMDIVRKEDPKGDRVVITMDGKFLPYKKW